MQHPRQKRDCKREANPKNNNRPLEKTDVAFGDERSLVSIKPPDPKTFGGTGAANVADRLEKADETRQTQHRTVYLVMRASTHNCTPKESEQSKYRHGTKPNFRHTFPN